MTRRRLAAAAAAASVLVLVPATAGMGAGKKPVKKTVTIGDNYYTPPKLTVPKGSTITWRWPSDTGDTHDVKLGKGPKGAKKFESEVAAAQYSFKQTLKVAGKYHVICTLHDDMTQDITVR